MDREKFVKEAALVKILSQMKVSVFIIHDDKDTDLEDIYIPCILTLCEDGVIRPAVFGHSPLNGLDDFGVIIEDDFRVDADYYGLGKVVLQYKDGWPFGDSSKFLDKLDYNKYAK